MALAVAAAGCGGGSSKCGAACPGDDLGASPDLVAPPAADLLTAAGDLASSSDLSPSADLLVPLDLVNAPPLALSFSPASGTLGAPLAPTIVVQFNQAMNTASTTITLSGVALTNVQWLANDSVFTATTSSNLAYATTYTITAAGSSKTGVALVGTLTSTFTTIGAPDTTAPTVLAVTPTDASTDVSIAGPLTATFSEAVDPATVSVTLAPNAIVGWTMAADNKSLTVTIKGVCTLFAFNPVTHEKTCASSVTPTFSPFTAYAWTIKAKDYAGNALAGKVQYTFTTGRDPAIDIKSTTPQKGASSVSTSTTVTIKFARPIKQSDIVAGAFTVGGDASPAFTVASPDSTTAVLTFTSALPAASELIVHIVKQTIHIADGSAFIGTGTALIAGVPKPADYIFSFSTGADTSRPTLTKAEIATASSTTLVTMADAGAATLSAMPADGLQITFNEVMNTVASNAGFVIKQGGTPLPTTVSWDATGKIAYLNQPLDYGTTYTLNVDKTVVKDLAGNSIATSGSFVYTFTTPYVKSLVLMPHATSPRDFLSPYQANLGIGVGASDGDAMQPTADKIYLTIGERNYFTSSNNNGAIEGCVLLIEILTGGMAGGSELSCAAGASSDYTWTMARQDIGFLEFTLPDALFDASVLSYRHAVIGSAARAGTGDPLALAPTVHSIYTNEFDLFLKNGGTDIAGDPTTPIYDAAGKWAAIVTNKVIADIGRHATQQNQSQFMLRMTTPADGDHGDDLMVIEQPTLTITYLSSTP